QVGGGTRDSGGSGRGVLRDDRAGRVIGPGHLGGGSEVKRGAAKLNGGSALVEADEVGHGDFLWAQTFSELHMPFAADDGSGGGRLRGDMSGGSIDAVEMIFNAEVQPQRGGFAGGLRDCESFETGDGDFGSVNREVHGDDGREQGEPGEHQQNQQESKGAEHSLLSVLDGVGDFGGFLQHFGDGAVLVFRESDGVFRSFLGNFAVDAIGEMDAREDARGFGGLLGIGGNGESGEGLALFLKDAYDIDGSAGAEGSEHGLHGAGAGYTLRGGVE